MTWGKRGREEGSDAITATDRRRSGRRIRTLAGSLFVLVVLCAVVLVGTTGVAVANHEGVQHVLGGEETEGALRIVVTDGNLAVYRYETGQWIRQYYSEDSSETALYIDGTLYDIPGGGIIDVGGTELAVADQSTTNDGDTVVTEYEPAGSTGVVLVQRVSYSGSREFFDLTWEVRNTGSEPVSDLRLFNGKDTYLAGDDDGYGFWTPGLNTVGVTKPVSGEQQRLALRGITDPYSYRSAYYDSIEESIEAASLGGVVTTEFHDNGYALEWRRASLGAGETWTVRARESFTRASVVVTGPGTVSSTGGPVDLPFDVENVGESEATVGFTTSGPGGWTLSAPTDISIPSGEARTVTVTATPSGATGSGLYDVTLTASSATSTDSDTAQVDLSVESEIEQPRPERRARFVVTDASVNRSEVTVRQPVAVSVTVRNSGDRSGRFDPVVTSDNRLLTSPPAVRLDPGESHTYTFTVSWNHVGTNRLFFNYQYVEEVSVFSPGQLREGSLTLRNAYLTRSAVTAGESYGVVALVENADDRAGTLELDYRGGVWGNASLDRTVRLVPGEREMVRITRTIPSVTAERNLSWTVAAGNGSRLDAGTLTVSPASGPLEDGIVDAYLTRKTVAPGESYQVVAVVRNTHDRRWPYALAYIGQDSFSLRMVWVPADTTMEVPNGVVATGAGTERWTVGDHDAGAVDVTGAAGS